jgi:DNA-directed RNA polymerase subunit RPC12/RpoP
LPNIKCEMNVLATTPAGRVRAKCSRCRRPVEMTRFVDPRTVDQRPREDRLREWDPADPPISPTIYKCTRCGHESHTAATAA